MDKEIQKISQSDNPESYDLLRGTPNIERVFTYSCSSTGKQALPVFTWRVNEVIRRGNYWMKHVRYPYLALEMILEGEMEFRTEEQYQVAGPGTLYLIPPGTTVRFTCPRNEMVRKRCALMGGENLKGILLTLKLSNSRTVPLAEPEIFAEKLKALKDAVDSPGVVNSARSYLFLLELSELIGKDISTRTSLMKAIAMLEANFQENLEIPAIAAHAGVSESTLRRLFKTEMHCSPLDYLNSVRLKFAAGKLRRTNLRIKEISIMSGFSSSARFCTVFQEKYGISPGDFRKRERQEKTN